MDETFNERNLRAAGFTLMDERREWFNSALRKAFSHEAAREYRPHILRACIKEREPEGEFWFYRISVPGSDEAEREILQQLDMMNLQPIPCLGPRSS